MNQDENDKTNLNSTAALLRFLATPPEATPGATGLPISLSAEETADCPRVDQYVLLTQGRTTKSDSERLLAHASTCDRCGQMLAGSLTVLEGNSSQEEIEAIAELAAHKHWQRETAKTLAATKASQRPMFLAFRSPRKIWRVGGLVAAGLIGTASLWTWQVQRNTPEHELGMAYAQSRAFELRIPEASFATIGGTHTRGIGDSPESSPLLEARARLARELERSPRDPRWLALQARADLLEERYESAVDVLDRLIAIGPVTAELLCDGASAYYQRGLVSGSEIDRSTALDYLRRADSLAPTDPVVLFNEAIVMEDRGQMMNAVEVWNRYITVERDEKWKEEGKRKLATLEQTLNRLKSHQSRMMQMLATPQAMDDLARSPENLQTWDEELTSMELDKLIPAAFPLATVSQAAQQARGSPPAEALCPASCLAVRRLLKALAVSLETQHHDSWLSDLLTPLQNSPSPASYATYAEAMRSLAQASRENQTGIPSTAARLALTARKDFQSLRTSAATAPWLAAAARVGDLRSAVEYMFSLQREVAFGDCRVFGHQLRAEPSAKETWKRYPWIDAAEAITEKVCDDTSLTRPEGHILIVHALHIAQSSHYTYLISRAHMREVDDAQNSGDVEEAERIALEQLHILLAMDVPVLRITNTLSGVNLAEHDSPRPYMRELAQRENLAWYRLQGNPLQELISETGLVRSELKIGNVKEAVRLLQLVASQRQSSGTGSSIYRAGTEGYIALANTMLESGDVASAQRYLDLAENGKVPSYSDTWALRAFAGAKGMLALVHGNLNEATSLLETQIRTDDSDNLATTDSSDTASYAQLDHDLYAELAATWLAQGRPPESVLALWERFRLRSRGLAGAACPKGELDCEQTRLLAAQQQLGDNILIGQVVLPDRVLIYRMDRSSIRWTQKQRQRQELLDTVSILQRTISTRYATSALTDQLGGRISDSLLPALPPGLSTGATLFLEPDPSLQNLPWPALPTPSGPMGLSYPLAELRSVLAVRRTNPDPPEDMGGELIVGASVASRGQPPLPEAIDEAKLVSRYARAPELLVGKHATTSDVAEALDSATVFHFAGHALQSGKGTKLLLAPGSPKERAPWIDGAFLRRYPPRSCKLAVLSACATGRHEASWNSPLQDIVETFGNLGVPDVVATRWEIDSKAAVPFMGTFYQGLAQGRSVSLALMEARKLQSRQSQDNSPYYWAAYYVTETENPFKKGRGNGKE